MRRIRVTSKGQPRIRDTGPGQPLVAQEVVAAALGARPSGAIPVGLTAPAFVALRTEIANRLGSTGGRPALKGAERRQKVPLSDGDWAVLVQLAVLLTKNGGRHVAPAQVASALLHLSLMGYGVSMAHEVSDEQARKFYRSVVESLTEGFD